MGWGSSTRRGGGRKVRALPRNFATLGFEERNLGCPGNFAGMSRIPGGVQKMCAKKVRAHFSLPILNNFSDLMIISQSHTTSVTQQLLVGTDLCISRATIAPEGGKFPKPFLQTWTKLKFVRCCDALSQNTLLHYKY